MAAAKNPGAIATAKPRQEWEEIVQAAIKAQTAANDHLAALGNRTPPAFMTAFAADIDGLNASIPGTINVQHGAVQLTAEQNDALVEGHHLVLGSRLSVRGMTSNEAVLLAYGVGTSTALLVKDVKAALQKIIDRATAEPAEAESFGIVDDDVKLMKGALKVIKDADSAQETARANAPKTTKDRNATARRLLAGIKRITGAGIRTFFNDPPNRAKFEALK